MVILTRFPTRSLTRRVTRPCVTLRVCLRVGERVTLAEENLRESATWRPWLGALQPAIRRAPSPRPLPHNDSERGVGGWSM